MANPMTKPNEIYFGNCIKTLSQMPDESVDLVITDPPYPNRMNFFSKSILDGYAALYLCCKKAKNYVVFFWNPFSIPRPPEGWHEVARHIWHKPDCTSSTEYEPITVWAKNPKRLESKVWSIPILDYRSRNEWQPLPTQKPLLLIQKLIELYSKPGDTILDPFLGTGTTAIACQKTRRNYIGIEINPKNYQIAGKRLARWRASEKYK